MHHYNNSVMPAFLRLRLTVQIFMAYTVMGAWLPIFTLYLTKQLHFSPIATAWASMTNAIGALFAPLIWGQVADRWLPMQRCISLCALMSGLGLWLLTTLTEPWEVFLATLAVWFFLAPLTGLTTSFVFRHLEHPERDFGPIRVWGTIGWMAANWLLTAWFHWRQPFGPTNFEAAPTLDLADSLRLGALAGVVVSLYATTLPHTPPQPSRTAARSWLRRLIDAPWSTLYLFRRPSFVIYCICIFGFYVTMTFPIQLNPLLLKAMGFEQEMLPSIMTISQCTEAVTLFLLPMMLTRFGVKAVMLVGCSMWTAGLAALGSEARDWLMLAALGANGLFISCYVVAGQVFVNRQVTHDIRASAQGLLVLITGCGLMVGHLLVGAIRETSHDDFMIAYLTSATLASLLVALFAFGFSASE